MIISRVIGGLGNQMFQYAVGRSIALDVNKDLLLDTNSYDDYKLHNGYELNAVFGIKPKLASQAQINEILGLWKNRYLKYALNVAFQLGLLSPKNIIKERSFAYDKRVSEITSDVYLEGYWQSEKYFIKNAQQIRDDFIFKFDMSDSNRALMEFMLRKNSVSLHIRRGDYVSNSAVAERHGVCSLDYYHAAIELIRSQLSNPSIFVFSDDIDWARSNVRTSLPLYFVDHNIGIESYKDMYFMSQCKHNIIANSSFSWWGAWLNPNHQKIVIAPKLWFKDKTNTIDLIPEGWVRI